MDIHKNARLTPKGRDEMVRAVVDRGLSKAAAAHKYNTTPKTVAKWVGRFAPRKTGARLIMPNGVNLTCRIIDMSESGAGIATGQRPPIGTLVTVGKVTGRVVRHLEEGFAIEFTRLQHSDFVEDNLTAE
jgi:hypothetical protein